MFFFPLGLYLFLLGSINRRQTPLLVSGTWDQIGLLFAGSGFLLFGGPAILSSLHERWRMFWLFGGDLRSAETSGQLWMFLAAGYFALVVAGSVLSFWRQRSFTSVYNVAPRQFERALQDALLALRLKPVRSGNLFLFGVAQPPEASADILEEIDPGANLPLLASETEEEGPANTRARADLPPAALLEMDPFPLFRHIALRWDPADAYLRQAIEAELARQLSHSETREHDTGAWLTLVGFFLIMSCGLAALVLVVRGVFLV